MGMERTSGFDWTLPAGPPLLRPPLSLLSLSTTLINVDAAVQAGQDAQERLMSAQAAGELSSMAELEALASARQKELADAQRWEDGFEYWLELSNDGAMELFVPGSGLDKLQSANPPAKSWYDPFVAVARDVDSMFGWPYNDIRERARHALRALEAHESWQVEREFWSGSAIPTNYHLAAGPGSPIVSAHRTIDAWAAPTPAPGTTLGAAVGLRQSLAALDQAIATSDAGVGMIHATPFLVQLWASTYPFLRDSAGRIYTVNFNLIVPGYGYPGSGPARVVTDGVLTNADATVTSAAANFTDADVGASIAGDDVPEGATILSVTDEHTIELSAPAEASAAGVDLTIVGGDASASSVQWAYATDSVYRLVGAARTLPWDFREGAPEVNVNNSAEVRAEQSHALLTNQLLRAAVLVDTETA